MKYIPVPISLDAMERLDKDKNLTGDLYEILLTEDEFSYLWEHNIFKILNNYLNINIDDYEDESITNYEDLVVMKDVLESNNKNYIVQKLLDLTELAIKYKTGIFFFF